MRTALLTFFTILLLSTALAASAFGAVGSPASVATSDLSVGSASVERQVVGTSEAVAPIVLLPPTSGLPNTSTAPSSAPLLMLMAGAVLTAGLTLIVLAGRRRS
jgi:hypothetical protein